MPKKVKKSSRKQPTIHFLGYVPVDSGQVMVVDPQYIFDWNEADCLTASQLTLGDTHGGQYMKVEKTPGDSSFAGGGFRQEAARLGFDKRGFFSVLSATGFGDGLYPVYAVEEDCGESGHRIRALEIRFDENEWIAPTGRIPEAVATDSPENVKAALQRFEEHAKKIAAHQMSKNMSGQTANGEAGSVLQN